MPLLTPSEYSPESLMADLPLQRAALNQLTMQLTALGEGLNSPLNPLVPPSQRGQTTYMVGSYETLPTIAAKLYGDPSRWPQLATANGIEYPYLLTPGQALTIPNG
jgi:nucleoid-associated protein YgaU